jgi:hypothetical protein
MNMKLAIVIGVALVVLQGCHLLPARSGPDSGHFSNKSQRLAWTQKLEAESVGPAKVTFHSFGHLLAASGKFLIPDTSPQLVSEWLTSHGDMLGIPSDAQLIAREGESQSADSEVNTDLPTRTLIYEVAVRGFPFSGIPIRVVIDPNERAIRAVINGFSPPVRGFGDIKASPEDRAWMAAEKHLGGTLQRVASVQTWFDKEWSLNRLPGVKELHWRLQGTNSDGMSSYVFVRASDDSVSYATPSQSFFDVPQTHRDDAGNVLWDSQTLPQGCTAGSAGCSGNALAQSQISRVVFPAVVDAWYRLSSPVAGAPFQWPFTGLHKGPYDNRLQAVRAVVGHNSSMCSIPCRFNGTYYFPSNTLVTDQYGLFGHEYGHGLLQEMKLVHPGTAPGNIPPPAQFTEAMADLIGIVSNYQLRREQFHVGSRFAIGEIKWTQVSGGWNYTPAPVDWELKEGACPSYARDRIGRAFYNAWKKVELDLWGSSPRPNDPDHQKLFRAWWIVIMSTFADLPDFPAIDDFYAAMGGDPHGFFQYEARVYYALSLELERLGLATGCR